MPKQSSGNGNINLSAKWLLRIGALLLLLTGFVLFLIPQTVYLNIVGLSSAGSIGCLFIAELCEN